MFGYRANFTLDLNTAWPKFIVQGEPRATTNRYGQISRVAVPITHSELGLFKEISGNDTYTLQEKLNQLLVTWDKKYQAHLEKLLVEDGKHSAEALVEDAQAQIRELSQILKDTLDFDDTVNWDGLKSTARFQKTAFENPKPAPPKLPRKPVLDLPVFVPEAFEYPDHIAPEVPFLMRAIGRRSTILEKAQSEWLRLKKAAEAKHRLEQKKRKAAHDANVAQLERDHENAVLRHQQECERLRAAYARRKERWLKEREHWDAEQARLEQSEIDRVQTHNLSIDRLKEQWQNGSPEAVVEHACMVLDNSTYPDWFQGSYRFSFDHTNRLAQVEFLLPAPEIVDLTKSARFVASTGEIKTTKLSKADQKKLYDDLCYQVALRTVHELFEADTVGSLNAILFNGVVDQINRATGNEERPTIMSGMFERSKFFEINLERVDPKACFKSFKGVSAASLIGLAPIAPIMEVAKDDERFIEDRSVAETIAPELNLAAMGWEDFEHLVREVFGKEFEVRGGEVKVTQSSSDGGVDAVAFDPDPISGGKIVIQAKRYTRTVGVAAVRDLYGTVMNEGASKGLLVTTADYGPDAYKFAADKPLTLLNGSNLLFMLEKHGINAMIDISAARKELGLNPPRD